MATNQKISTWQCQVAIRMGGEGEMGRQGGIRPGWRMNRRNHADVFT